MIGLCSLALLAAAPQDDYESIFTNTGFEEGLAGWRPLDLSGACDYDVVDDHHGGRRALRITRGAGSRPDWLKQNGELHTDTGSVLLRLYYCTRGPGSARVTGYFWDAGGNTIGDQRLVVDIGETGPWTEAQERWEVPEGAVGFGINVRTTEPGVVLIDDVVAEYRPGEPRAELASLFLLDPSFDEGMGSFGYLRGSRRVAPLWDPKAQAIRVGIRPSRRPYPQDGVVAETRLTAGEERIRARVRVHRLDRGTHAGLVLQARTRTGAPLASARAEVREGARRTLEVELDVPRGTARIAVYLTVGGEGTVNFDDVELEAVE